MLTMAERSGLHEELTDFAEELTRAQRLPPEGTPVKDWTSEQAQAFLAQWSHDVRRGSAPTWVQALRQFERDESEGNRDG